jgi:hypothetical protein
MAMGRCARCWTCVLDLGLTLWVLRAIVVAVLLGFAILGLTPQAQDLLLDVAAGPWWYIILYLLSVFFVWAMPTHYAARLLVNTDRRYLMRVRRRKGSFICGLQKWTPRILGTLPFGAMVIGVWRAFNNVPSVQPPSETEDAKFYLILLAAYLFAAAALFWWYLASRRAIGRLPAVEQVNALAKRLIDPIAARVPRALALGRHAPGLSRAGSDLGPLYLALMFFLFTFLPFFAPVLFAEWLPRAIAVPFVFAGWTPLAAYAAGVGRHLRVPIISFALLGVAVLTYLLGDNYAVRLINAEKHAGEVVKAQSGKLDDYSLAEAEAPLDQRLKLHDAVRLWKQANRCDRAPATCPRPIIIAASGGASRAGFFTASTIGKLMDGGGGIAPGAIRERLFAISSVSGSSVGAVMSVAALAAAERQQPCNKDGFYLRYEPEVKDWRSCLEALMSGDFLTPVFAGAAFRDTLRFLGSFASAGSGAKWSDRASLIEQSWERHFRRSLRTDDKPSPLCRRNLDCPFLSLRPRENGDDVEWLPVLLLNGTSVSTGQRIVTSTLDPWYEPRPGQCPRALAEGDAKKCPLLDHAFDFHWLISRKQQTDANDSKAKGANPPEGAAKKPEPVAFDDIRLSTAAHNSARFPLISPPGEVRDQTDNVVDRIVDGGFFENFGAQTALEIATAIRAVDPDLVPFVLIISNDPEIPTEELKTPDAEEGEFLSDLSAPTKTILATRAARGTIALDAIATVLGEELNERCVPNATHIRVWPEFTILPEPKSEKGRADRKSDTDAAAPGANAPRKVRPLSFSWWLSKPVQRRLHQQTEFTDPQQLDNQQALRFIATALGPRPLGCAGRTEAATNWRKYEGVRPQLRLQRQRP